MIMYTMAVHVTWVVLLKMIYDIQYTIIIYDHVYNGCFNTTLNDTIMSYTNTVMCLFTKHCNKCSLILDWLNIKSKGKPV